MSGPTLQTRQCTNIPSRSLMVLNAKATIGKHMEGGLYKVVPNFLSSDEYPELVLIPTIHNVEIAKTQCIPFVLLNLSEEGIFLKKGEICRHLEEEDITIEEITTETMLQDKDMESEKLNCSDSLGKTFVASPADGDTYRKVKLQDAEVLNHYKDTIEGITAETMLQNDDMESEKLNCSDSLEETFIASPADVDTYRKVKLQDAEVLNHYKNTVGKITTETMLQSGNMESKKPNCDISLETMFIASPADVDTNRKVKLQDVEVLNHYKNTVGKITTETMLQSGDMESKKPN